MHVYCFYPAKYIYIPGIKFTDAHTYTSYTIHCIRAEKGCLKIQDYIISHTERWAVIKTLVICCIKEILLPGNLGIIISHCQDPYEPISRMEGHFRFLLPLLHRHVARIKKADTGRSWRECNHCSHFATNQDAPQNTTKTLQWAETLLIGQFRRSCCSQQRTERIFTGYSSFFWIRPSTMSLLSSSKSEALCVPCLMVGFYLAYMSQRSSSFVSSFKSLYLWNTLIFLFCLFLALLDTLSPTNVGSLVNYTTQDVELGHVDLDFLETSWRWLADLSNDWTMLFFGRCTFMVSFAIIWFSFIPSWWSPRNAYDNKSLECRVFRCILLKMSCPCHSVPVFCFGMWMRFLHWGMFQDASVSFDQWTHGIFGLVW